MQPGIARSEMVQPSNARYEMVQPKIEPDMISHTISKNFNSIQRSSFTNQQKAIHTNPYLRLLIWSCTRHSFVKNSTPIYTRRSLLGHALDTLCQEFHTNLHSTLLIGSAFGTPLPGIPLQSTLDTPQWVSHSGLLCQEFHAWHSDL